MRRLRYWLFRTALLLGDKYNRRVLYALILLIAIGVYFVTEAR